LRRGGVTYIVGFLDGVRLKNADIKKGLTRQQALMDIVCDEAGVQIRRRKSPNSAVKIGGEKGYRTKQRRKTKKPTGSKKGVSSSIGSTSTERVGEKENLKTKKNDQKKRARRR